MPDDHVLEALRLDLIAYGFLKPGASLPETFTKEMVYYILDTAQFEVRRARMDLAEDHHKTRVISDAKH